MSTATANRTTPQEIAVMAHQVSVQLGNNRPEGPQNPIAYQDDRLRITNNPQKFTLQVMILNDGRWVTVYSAHGARTTQPKVYHPGLWTKHLEALHQQALEAADYRLNAFLIRHEVHTTVDDTELFAEYIDPDAQPEHWREINKMEEWASMLTHLGGIITIDPPNHRGTAMHMETLTARYTINVDFRGNQGQNATMKLTAEPKGPRPASILTQGEFETHTWDTITLDILAHELSLAEPHH